MLADGSAEDDLGRIYARYVPRLITERLVREARAVDAPSAEGLRGAILFADISGFTPLTEAFAAKGPEGAEALTRILNDYFGRMTEIVFNHGGDVLKFAGDALMALWRPESDTEDIATACRRATRCGLELQASLAGYEAEGHPLSLRVAVGTGNVSVVHVGGQFDRWEFAIAGSPLNQVGKVGDLAERGEVLVSAQVWSQIGSHCDGELISDDGADPELTAWPPRRIDAIDAPEPAPAPPQPRLPVALEPALRGYLPASITRRIMAGQTDFLGELRRLTILFVNLPDITYETPLEVAQEAFRGLQKALYLPWEGSINKLSVDDKGISLVAALGLPPFAHEDDPARGAQAAMAMHEVLRKLGQRCSIGVTSGRVYCGSVGGSGRQEYTIMGDRVNLAARLMQNANGGILCDAATAERSTDHVRYAEPETISVKGKAEPLATYRPLGQQDRQGKARETDVLIGRVAELAQLRAGVNQLIDQGRSGVLHVEGEAGVGKSRLLEQFTEDVRAEAQVRVLEGAADAIEQNTSYFAWQSVLLALFDLQDIQDTRERRTRIETALKDDAKALEMLPLLNAILPLEIPETDLIRQMSGEVRGSNLENLIVSLLEFSAARSPLLLLIDDVHWMDSASWNLVERCVQRVTPMFVVLGGRPVPSTDQPDALRLLMATPNARALSLERLEPEQCVELVAHRLGVKALPELAATVIRERAEGHPYFSEEIGYALRDSAALLIDGDTARMANESIDAAALDLPDTIEGIITSRIDRLSPQQQLALKVASCIGRVFSLALLTDIYPVQQDRDALTDELGTLAGLDLTPVDAPDPDPAYIFKHAITRQVAYDLMLYAQRKQLHESIARWHEHMHADDLAPYHPVLAHHWGRAEDDERAVHYLILAARRALTNNANPEALEFLDDAMARVPRLAKAPTDLERGRWAILRGTAEYALGRLNESRSSFEAGLGLIGYPVPASTPLLIGSILRQTLIQRRHRRQGTPQGPVGADAITRLELAAETVERLFIIYLLLNDAGRTLWSTLRATNLAESIGRDTPTLIRAYTDLSLALASIPMQKQVDHYEERAMTTAENLDALPDLAWANLGTSACIAATAQWSEIERRSTTAIEVFKQLGDLRQWETASANLGLIRTIYGRFDEPEESLYMPVLEAARKRGIKQTEGWGLAIWGMNLQYMQRFDELAVITRDLGPWYAEAGASMDEIARLEVVAIMMLAALRAGDESEIEKWQQLGAEIMAEMGRPAQYRNLPCQYLYTEALIDWWQRAEDSSDSARRRQEIKRMLKALKTFASIFPIGAPRLLWLQGRIAWFEGRHKEACGLWRSCLERAQQLDMAYDVMLAAQSLGHCIPVAEPQHAAEAETHAALGAELTAEMQIPGSSFVVRPA